jgi:hypothetical protein
MQPLESCIERRTEFIPFHATTKRNKFHSTMTRRGLAPLELVLCLPVLLFVLALIVDAGSKSCWKMRGLVAARDAAWRSRYGRSGANLPNAVPWRSPATMEAGPAGANANLQRAELDQVVVRGPTLGSFLVDRDLLDQTRGGWVGSSQRVWIPPLLPKLGAAPMNQQHPLIDGKWQYSQMGIPSTIWRRIPFIYTLPQADPNLKASFLAAVQAAQSEPLHTMLAPLDRDEEIRAWYGNYHDFHPRVGFCDFDRLRVANKQLVSLVRRIQGGIPPSPASGIPGQMVRFWISMYSQQRGRLLALVAQIQAGQATGDVGALMAQAGLLEGKIKMLSDFLETLPK